MKRTHSHGIFIIDFIFILFLILFSPPISSPYYDKFDFYYGIPGFHVYSKYGQGDTGYAKAVFASDHGYSSSYGGGYGGYGGGH